MPKKERNKRPLPSDSQVSEGANLALTNARRHMRVAEVLGAERLFGPASTHVVLALEELAKSWVLTFIVIGVDVPKSLRSDVMKKHTTRHSLAFGTLFSKAIRSLVFSAIARSHRSGDGSLKQMKKELKKEARSSRFTATLEWIIDANDLKNRGLYVDFDGKKWSHPGRISKKSFLFGYQIAEGLLREQSKTLRKIHRTGFKADDSFKKLMGDALTISQTNDEEKRLKETIKFILS
jgi:AbiV family abortive infection protein